MTVASPASERRRPRPGSLERPVNGRLYRGVWLLVALPVLLLAFSVSRPPALQPSTPALAFAGPAAAAIADDLSTRYPNRVPGTPGAAGAEGWFKHALAGYGFDVQREAFTATVRGRPVTLVNLVAENGGLSPQRGVIVVMAHRDDSGTGAGLNDNASGTGALIELARSYAPSLSAQPNSLPYSIAFVSTDGAEDGALGAAHFADEASTRRNAVAVINLDSIGGKGSPRLEFGGDTPRSPAPGLLATLQTALKESGATTTRPGTLDQLVNLGFPFNAYEQAPFVSNGTPAVTITTARDRPAEASRTQRLRVARLTEAGLATENAVNAIEEGALAQGPSSYLFVGQRLIRGWAIELVLIAMLLPFIAAAVDLFARCRRRRIPIAPALRSYRSRLVFWILGGLAFLLFAAVGFLGDTHGRPAPLNDVRWPTGALLVLALLGVASWLVLRDRLVPRRAIRTEEELAGYTAALLALSVVGLLVAATNPYALVFLLPCLHFWLWLPHVHTRPRAVRVLVLLVGLAGPAYLVWTFATHYRLGWDAPWYIAQLFAVGYAPRTLFVIALAWLAAASQMFALAGNRYAPYPAPGEAPRRGPIRDLIRTLVLEHRRRVALMERSSATTKRPRRP